MFVRSKKYYLKIKELEYTIEALGKKVKQLECKHEHTKTVRYTSIFIGFPIADGSVGYEKCKNCGKTMQYFDTEQDIREHEISKAKREVSRLEDMPPAT